MPVMFLRWRMGDKTCSIAISIDNPNLTLHMLVNVAWFPFLASASQP